MNKGFSGHKHSEDSKELIRKNTSKSMLKNSKSISKRMKKQWKNKKYRKFLSTRIQEHHIDLNKRNNDKLNILKCKTRAQHSRAHRLAYHYLLNKFGITEIKKYIKWLKKNPYFIKGETRWN